MSEYFNEDANNSDFVPFKDDAEDLSDENDMARLASLHVGEILDDDGSVLREQDNIFEGDPEEPLM
jgi:hypothetical protein